MVEREIGKNAVTHGHVLTGIESPTYRSWKAMKRRCTSNDPQFFKNYKGKGISYSESWGIFETFLADMGERPDGTTLDRIENDKGYSKDNCRWVSREEQNRNRSSNKLDEAAAREIYQRSWSGEPHSALSKEFGCSYSMISNIKNGHVWATETGHSK